MLGYLKKFAVDIFPSVAATVIGAYIVNHYIITKPGADAPPAAAASTANPKVAAKSADDASNIPAAGVKAKGISEKGMMEKTAAERPAMVEKPQAEAKADNKADVKPDAKPADAPAETASIPADQRRHAAVPREKEKIRVVLPSPVQPVATATVPIVTAPVSAPAPVETATTTEERRDANDLARAAIERLRVNGEGAPRAPEAVRVPETPRVANAPVIVNAPALRPLPPPIMVSGAPAGEPFGQTSGHVSPMRPPFAEVRDPSRPTPPAEIPLSRPLDLRAEIAEPSVRERATAVAEDALSTAKSLFHSVLPK
ncbi:MAG: hypothetical protein PS018_12965 [bacterium]|nr:hypothetical protein [bacterium]